MTSTKKDSNPPLLSDEAFTELMSAEHEQRGVPVDEVAKQRVWKNISASIDDASQNQSAKEESKITKKPHILNSSWRALAASIAAIALAVPLLMTMNPDNHHDEMFRAKGNAAHSAVTIQLTPYTLNHNNELEPLGKTIHNGQTIMFKIETSQPTWTLLALAKNGQVPTHRFIAESTHAQQSVLLARDEQAYGYVVEPDDQQLTFCTLSASSQQEAESLIPHLNERWPNPAEGACLSLSKDHR